MTFDVWAPLAERVWLQVDGSREPMTSVEGGWWQSAHPWEPGVDYGYVLDEPGNPVLPDPRSRRQPDGVHGVSRSDDPAGHPWSDGAWKGRELQGSIIYELHIGTFTPGGTFDSAIEKLDHLVDLGIGFVELLPVNAFNGIVNWGYDGVLWYAVHEPYGGPDGYRRFVGACHARGLAVIQDVVYNHLGPSGNYLPNFGPYLDSSGASTWGDHLNLAEPEVREYIIANALMWFEDFHVDGLRLDAVHALVDNSPKHILQELAERVDALDLGRPLSLIAESDLNDAKLITSRDQGGYGLTAQWSDDYHHAAHVNLTGETDGYYADFDSLAALGKVLTGGFFHDGTWSSFRERMHGSPIDAAVVPTWRLVTYVQDHDQIGNRATGDRHSEKLDYDGLALAAVLNLASPFTPMLFMGEEWGATTPWQFFTSHPEPELGRLTAEGRIAEFEKMGWDPDVVPDPQDRETFERSRLDWNEPSGGDHARLMDLYRELARVRASTPGLTDARLDATTCEWDENQRWLRFTRPGVAVALNFGSDAVKVAVAGGAGILLATANAELRDDVVMLPARSAVIVTTA